MSKSEPAWPPVAADTYEVLRPVLGTVRVMERFLDEVVAPDPELSPLYERLQKGYMDLMAQVLAPHAFHMATVLVALEDAYTVDDDGPEAA